MHKIYFDDRSVTICGIPEKAGARPADTGAAVPEMGMKALAEDFKTGKLAGHVTVRCSEPDEAYRTFCSCFKEVCAAGGVVTDGKGRFLLIKRNSVWDLPKGHQEEGEEISVTALREVEEETGAEGLVLGDLITVTDHCYLRDGIHHLKHTWWFKMEAGDGSLVPQSEEGISEAVWVPGNGVDECMKNTYPSIKDVFSFILDEK